MGDAISISKAKRQLSKLVARAQDGEEITIRRGNTPVARLRRDRSTPAPSRSPLGALRGQIWIADDFDELGPEWGPNV